MTLNERTVLYKEALEKWGEELQVQMVIEEMSELMVELCRAVNGRGSRERLSEEVADVLITLEELVYMFDLNEEVEGAIERSDYAFEDLPLIQEMALLVKELCKGFRGVGNREALIESTVKVSLSLNNLIQVYRIQDEVECHKEEKLNRLRSRLQG